MKRNKKEFLDIIKSHPFNKNDTILEIGCEDGSRSFSLAKENYRVTGVDESYSDIISAKFLKASQTRSIQKKLQFFQSPYHSLPLINSYFYGACIFDYPYFWDSDILRLNLEELYRVLAPNAILLVTLMSQSSFAVSNKNDLARILRFVNMHIISLKEENNRIIGKFRRRK